MKWREMLKKTPLSRFVKEPTEPSWDYDRRKGTGPFPFIDVIVMLDGKVQINWTAVRKGNPGEVLVDGTSLTGSVEVYKLSDLPERARTVLATDLKIRDATIAVADWLKAAFKRE